MQGYCAALELAVRGVNVDLFERTAMPMRGGITANSGGATLGGDRRRCYPSLRDVA